MSDSRDRLLLNELRDFATEVAWCGGRSALAWYQNHAPLDWKEDGSPVTVADREAEARMRARIRERYPDHGIVGEEEGEEQSAASIRWILDPIDGTRTFVRGAPLFGSLVGVEIEGRARVGSIYIPALNEMLDAAHGLGCRWNGRAARGSGEKDLDRSLVLTTCERATRQRSEGYAALVDRAELSRTWGDCYGYVLVATGRAEVMIDPEMNVWDAAPLLPIIEEAGGRFTSWSGEATIRGGDSVATNGILHDLVLETLSQP